MYLRMPSVRIEEDECDFDNCGNINYNDIPIILNRQANNFEYKPGELITVCDLNQPKTTKDDVGQSRPIPYERKRKELNWENSWEIKPCLNNNGKVQFSIVAPDRLQPTMIYFDFVEAVCEDIITNSNKGKIIRNLNFYNDVSSGVDAMHDFCGHQSYPIQVGTDKRPGYYIWEVIKTHEGIHGDRFYKILQENKASLINELNKLVLDCEEFRKYWKIEGVEQHIQNALNKYYRICEDEYYATNNEQNIQCHFAIRELIKQYEKQVNFFFGTKIPLFDCYSCP